MFGRIRFLWKSLTRKLTGLGSSLQDGGLSFNRALLLLGLVGLIVGIGINISISISKASENYNVLALERAKLERVRLESEKLDRDLEYYSSIEYKKRYAYDSLNLARAGEEIYIVDGEERVDYSLRQEEGEPVDQENNQLWWEFILRRILNQLHLG